MLRSKPKMKRRKKVTTKRKYCRFCREKLTINYKDAELLRKFTTERGKIIPRRVTGACALHQRRLTTAIKRARFMALIPYLET